MTEQKKKKSKWLLWLVIASTAIFLISPVALYRMKHRAAFERTLRELSEAGYPTTNEELQELYVLPEGVENAADIYQKAFAAYHEPNEADLQWLPYQGDYELEDGQTCPPEVLDAIARSLEQNAECLTLLDQAVQIDHCLFPIEFDGLATRLDHLSPSRNTSKLLVERNFYIARSGEPQALFQSLLTSLGHTRSMAGSYTVIEYCIALFYKRTVLNSVEDGLNLAEFSDEQLLVLQGKLHETELCDQFERALSGEVVFCVDQRQTPPLEVIENWGYAPDFYEKAMLFLNYFSGRLDKDYAFALDCYNKAIKMSKLPFHQQLNQINTLQQAEKSHRFCTEITEYLSPAFVVLKHYIRTIASLRCAETAMAIERYRLKYGNLPESLDVLMPEFIDAVRLDPFDGKPIRYKILENAGYTLYTVGEDRIDNGGIDEDHKPAGSDEFDYPFTVRRSDNAL